MENDGPLLKELQDALISAYPTRQDLAMMVAYGLGENLSALAGESNLEHTVYELLRWAQAHERRDELVISALLHNRQNPQLLHVASLLGLLHEQHWVTVSPFLCSAPKDLPLLNRLKDDLRVHGILAVKDPQASKQSSFVENEDVREAIRSASMVIVVASAQTRRSRRVKEALSIAQMYERRVCLFCMQADQLMEVMPTGYHLPYIDARAERYETALQELVQMLLRQTSFSADHAPQASGSETTLAAPRNPYKGLQAFHVEDARDFFGRDNLIKELLEKIQAWCMQEQQEQASARLLTMLGPSGSGKSSVMMAGLIPQLKQDALPGSQNWMYLDPIVPGKHPLEALAVALAPLFPERSPLSIVHEDLEDDSARGLHMLLTTYVKRSDMKVLLVVDQFEELFTQTATEGERQQFLDVLLAATSESSGPLMSVLTLRADFYDRLLQYPELGRLVKSQQIVVFPMEMSDLRKVIEQPARLPDVQLRFEEGLVGDLLFDVQGQVGALPLLQFTLDQLFECREERMLTLSAYHQIGGVKGALAQHTESTYQGLPTEDHQRLARALFLRLINAGTVEEDATRRRVPLSELVVVDKQETKRLAEVTNAFTKARLLMMNAVGGVSTVEVSHEALIQVWMRLQDWLHEARDDMRLRQTMSEDTASWNRYGRPRDRLYRGSQLIMALRWRKANLPSLEEDRFLQASVKERERQGRRTFFIGLASIVGMTATAIGMGALILRGQSSASIPPLAAVSLPYTYRGHSNEVYSVAWSPSGKQLASASRDQTVQVWDASSGRVLLTYKGHSNEVYSVAWSPSGKQLASASRDQTVQVWDAGSGRVLLTYRNPTGSVMSVAWSPDGSRIALVKDQTVQVWDASSGRVLLTYKGHSNEVYSVAWSPSGKQLASASRDQTVQVWDAGSGTLLLIYKSHSQGIVRVAWSPDEYRIAWAKDQTVQVWDIRSRRVLLTYKGHSNEVMSVAWSPSGKQLASAGFDWTVQVWDASSGRVLLTYKDHTAVVMSVAWSPNGKQLASASFDGTVQVWDASSGTLLLPTSVVNSVAWSPSGKLVATAGDDRTVQVWDAGSGTLLLTYKGHSDMVNSVAWSPSGKQLASVSRDGTVQVWDANNGGLLFTCKGHSSVAWSPSGRQLAAGFDWTVQVLDTNNGRLLFTCKGHKDVGYSSVAWSPSGKQLASASGDGTVQVWDARSGMLLLTYKGHSDVVRSVAWSPSGKQLASASQDGTVQVRDASSGTLLLTYKGHRGMVNSVAWSPSGKQLASASDDRTVQVWDAGSGTLLLTYRNRTAAAVYSVAWSPDGYHIASGGWDKTTQVWLLL